MGTKLISRWIILAIASIYWVMIMSDSGGGYDIRSKRIAVAYALTFSFILIQGEVWIRDYQQKKKG